MIPNLTLIITASALIGCGVYLLLARSVVRALIGFLLLSNGINVMFLVASGRAGNAPIIGSGDEPMTDPVPQALVLTAIVITLGLTAFVLALAHRAWQVGRSDLLDDDPESSRIHRKAESNDMSDDPGAQESVDAIASEFAEEDTEPPEGGDDR